MDNATDLINVFLLLTILRQARGIRLNLVNLLIPLIAVAASASWFLRTIPTAGHDGELIAVLGAAGALLGLLGGLAMVIEPAEETGTGGRAGGLMVRAGRSAVVVMALGAVARMAFAYAAGHGYGPQIGRFSRDHLITGQDAWIASLVLMALAEVLVRVVVTRVRGHLYQRSAGSAAGGAGLRAA